MHPQFVYFYFITAKLPQGPGNQFHCITHTQKRVRQTSLHKPIWTRGDFFSSTLTNALSCTAYICCYAHTPFISYLRHRVAYVNNLNPNPFVFLLFFAPLSSSISYLYKIKIRWERWAKTNSNHFFTSVNQWP